MTKSLGIGRGGARSGAGRPKGGKNAPKFAPPSPEEQSALEYALNVMRDPTADVKRRDSMARALLGFMRAAGRKGADDTAPAKDDGKWAGIL
jgi:hypothetical protein